MFDFLKRMALVSVFAALLAQPSLAAEQKPAKKLPSSPAEMVVARVNGRNITKENVDSATNNVLPQLAFHSFVSDEKLKTIRKNALETLINNEIIYKMTKDSKPEVKDKEIDAKVDELRKKVPQGESLEKVLQRSNVTMAEIREDFRKSILVERTTKKKAEEFKKKTAETVTEAYMKDYYQKNLQKFKEPEQVHLRSILIKADPAGGQRVWGEALKKGQDVVKLARGGEDFAKLAQKYSEDPFAKDGGDMGWAHKGSLFAEIDDAVAKMNIGEVSDPVMTLYGYHIVKLEGKKPSVQRKFDELNKSKLRKELEAKEFKRLWDAWVKEIRSTAKIEYVQAD